MDTDDAIHDDQFQVAPDYKALFKDSKDLF